MTDAIISPTMTMKRIAPAISAKDAPASGPPDSSDQSSTPIGSIRNSEPPNTQLIDISCSSIASACPPCRARDAAIAERMPPITGPAILIKVQIAAEAQLENFIDQFYGYELSVDGILKEIETGEIDYDSLQSASPVRVAQGGTPP